MDICLLQQIIEEQRRSCPGHLITVFVCIHKKNSYDIHGLYPGAYNYNYCTKLIKLLWRIYRTTSKALSYICVMHFDRIFTAWFLTTILTVVKAIKCYCTDDHCVPYGVCESAVCLVGILKSSNSVIRTCGSELIGCRRNVGRY